MIVEMLFLCRFRASAVITVVRPAKDLFAVGTRTAEEAVVCCLFKIHIQIAFEHTVVKLALFVGRSPEKLFEFFVGAYDRIAVSVLFFKDLTHNSVNAPRLVDVEQAFAVGRVCDDNAPFGFWGKIRNVTLNRRDEFSHPRFFRVFEGEGDGSLVNVACNGFEFYVAVYFCSCGLPLVFNN